MFNLQSIKKSNGIKAPRIMLYGPHGLGKTTFGANAPDPIFILTEDGLGQIEANHFPVATTYQEVLDAVGTLVVEEHSFKTVVIDSLDWLENIIMRDLEEKHDAKELAYGRGAVMAADYWRNILEGLAVLRDQKGMSIILLAHAEIKRFDSPEVEPFDRYQPKLQARSSALIQEWCDCVFFCNYKTIVKKEDVGFNKTVSRGITTGDRLIYTNEKPAYYAKNRFSLPDAIPLAWQAFQEAIQPTKGN